jgi:hypothetical protein
LILPCFAGKPIKYDGFDLSLHIVFSAKGDGTVTWRFHPPSLRSYGGQVENAILQKKVLTTRARSSGMKKICGVQEPV